MLVSIWVDDAAGNSSASSVLGVAASSLSSDAPAVAANNTATLLDSLTLAVMVLQVVTLPCYLLSVDFLGTHSCKPVFFPAVCTTGWPGDGMLIHGLWTRRVCGGLSRTPVRLWLHRHHGPAL